MAVKAATRKQSRVIPREAGAEVQFLADWLNNMLVAGRLAIEVKSVTEVCLGFRFVTGREVGFNPEVLGLGIALTGEELAQLQKLQQESDGVT